MQVSDVEFIYLNQIAGPTFHGNTLPQSTFKCEDKHYIDMQMQPDSWRKKYIDPTTDTLNVVKSFSMRWKVGHGVRHGVKPKLNKRQCDSGAVTNIFDFISLQKLQCRFQDPTDVFIC